ncbi:MAG: hypothetical protein JW726_16225 [Anaerolineales bacterium]|nr:hypothetical protein [Anaerolineales bacterium]
MMETSPQIPHNLLQRTFASLLGLYPPRFRRKFSVEIYEILLQRIDEAASDGRGAWLSAALRELAALACSVMMEQWHEHWSRKDKRMDSQDSLTTPEGGGALLQAAGIPGAGTPAPSPLWVAGWALLTTLIFPAAAFVSPIIAILFLSLLNLSVSLGAWSSVPGLSLQIFGFATAIALGVAAVQSLLLRRYLPKTGAWFSLTAGSLFLAGLAALWVIGAPPSPWLVALFFLGAGLLLGLAHWLYLHTRLPKAAWIILVDVLAVASLLLTPTYFTSIFDMLGLWVLLLPGTITGLGIWFLLWRVQPAELPANPWAERKKERLAQRITRLVAGSTLLIAFFYFAIWAYAASQLALAKEAGIYPTIEEAIIGSHMDGWGSAKVIAVSPTHAGPNRGDGSQPHVWFGTATVTFDRVPEGWHTNQYATGNFYIHVRDGWVFVGESTFPEFIGWVMELYHMEGVSSP